jgi:DNA-binding response OmpR family regulator
MTANALTGDRDKSITAGMDDHISKPVKLEELSRVLEKFFAGASENVPTNAAPALELAAPVDLDRLHLALGDDPEEILEILNLYRTWTMRQPTGRKSSWQRSNDGWKRG